PPACFTALLGSEQNGNWWIRPTDGPVTATRRRYRPDTLILESEWDTDEGTVRVIDFMPPRGGAPHLVRIVEGVRGRVRMSTALRVRFDYGNVVPWITRSGTELVAVAGPDSVWLSTTVPLRGHNFVHDAEFTVNAGQRVPFVLTWHPSHTEESDHLDAEKSLSRTERFWRQWVDDCSYKGEYRDAVVRSLITLKALTYRPTGGIVAAPTTSLPEHLGGVRNWDYRYCWLRDAAMTLEALTSTGYLEEAAAWRDWLIRAVAGRPEDHQVVYGVAGERRLPELILDWLPGYENSRPVRIGNGAAGQVQLDVYGQMLNALFEARRRGLPPDDHVWAMMRAVLGFLEVNWAQPDEGLWEVRGPRRHFVHSKVMAWVAFDRAVRAVRLGWREGPADRWQELRDRIHAEVCAKGYDPERATFTQSYGSRELDAALLLIPIVGFLPPEDPRVASTIAAIERELMTDGLVLRYPIAEENPIDGLPGTEGAFLACSFWLAQARAMTGRVAEAVELFELLLSLRNDVGLLAEEYDPRLRRQLGNFPQAFSHIHLVRTALALDRAVRAAGAAARTAR